MAVLGLAAKLLPGPGAPGAVAGPVFSLLPFAVNGNEMPVFYFFPLYRQSTIQFRSLFFLLLYGISHDKVYLHNSFGG